MSVLETQIVKTNDSAKIKSFKQILELQKNAALMASERQKVQDEYRKIEDVE
jgi:hypothetical protein